MQLSDSRDLRAADDWQKKETFPWMTRESIGLWSLGGEMFTANWAHLSHAWKSVNQINIKQKKILSRLDCLSREPLS